MTSQKGHNFAAETKNHVIMTTTNNTNYSVKALVAKYRNFVIENAPKKEGRIAERVFAKKGQTIPLSNLDWHPDYQLIITLYNAVIRLTNRFNKYYQYMRLSIIKML